MARPLRLHIPGGFYHVTARGNDRRPIFEEHDDHATFLIVLASVVARHHVRCHAYCLMGNHYHLLLETPEANLSIAMRQINGVYTQRFNRRHERSGHLLQGRFWAHLVDGESYLREVCRYIVLNPVRAGLVGHPGEWPWSSFRATVGETTPPGFLTVNWILELGGMRSAEEARRQYRTFVEAGIGQPAPLLDSLKSNLALGDDIFMLRLREQCPPAARSVEVPRVQRFAGRPPLSQLFQDVTSKADRNARTVLAIRDHGYAMREVAEFLGRHYATISRVMSLADGPARGGMS
jgi:putative transposase